MTKKKLVLSKETVRVLNGQGTAPSNPQEMRSAADTRTCTQACD